MTIQHIDKNDCYGCSACLDSCPVTAIVNRKNREGFYYPELNEDLCIDCGKCYNVCPVCTKVENENFIKPVVYAAWNKNEHLIEESTSGGLFSVFAEKILETKGTIYGAAFDENWQLEHRKAQTSEELSSLRKSKYLQSNCTGIYNKIEQDLKNNKTVLFTGTPCQVNGVKSFFKNNEKQNRLYTIDIICHGVNSPGVFDLYRKFLEKKMKGTMSSYNFRSKKSGWLVPKVEAVFGEKKYTKIFQNDPFIAGFRKNLFLRSSCYSCPHTKFPRAGDLTIGDYWGVPNNLYNKNGVSVCMVNSEKGKRLFSLVNSDLIFNKTDIDNVIYNNPQLYRQSAIAEKNIIIREKVFDLLEHGKVNYVFCLFIYGFPFPHLKKIWYLLKHLFTARKVDRGCK